MTGLGDADRPADWLHAFEGLAGVLCDAGRTAPTTLVLALFGEALVVPIAVSSQLDETRQNLNQSAKASDFFNSLPERNPN